MAGNNRTPGQIIMQVYGCPANTKMISVSSTSARTTTDFRKNKIHMFSSDIECYVKLGDSSVVASTTDFNFLLTKGTILLIDVGENTRAAAVTELGSGTLAISEMI